MDEFEIIPSEQWQEFFETFSRAHRGWLIRIWVIATASLETGSAENTDVAVRDLGLREIIVERHGERTDLSIIARDGEAHVDHTVRQLDAVTLERDTDGSESGLRLDSGGGESTLLRFRIPARPEALDGLAPGENP